MPTEISPITQAAEPVVRNVSTQAMVFDPEIVAGMQRMAEMMAAAKVTVPKHLQGSAADCLAIIMQAAQWQMNPFAVAQKTHLINGALGYESQLVSAVLSSSGAIRGRFHYEYRGESPSLECRVGGIPQGETEIVWGQWLALGAVKTRNSSLWQTNPAQQLGYLQVKNWARQYAPGAILGVYSADELEEQPERPITGTVIEEPIESASSRTETVKAKLRGKRQHPTEPAVTIAQVLARIEGVETEEDLTAAAELAGKLADPEDKGLARQAYKARSDALKKGSATEGPLAEPDKDSGETAGEEVF